MPEQDNYTDNGLSGTSSNPTKPPVIADANNPRANSWTNTPGVHAPWVRRRKPQFTLYDQRRQQHDQREHDWISRLTAN